MSTDQNAHTETKTEREDVHALHGRSRDACVDFNAGSLEKESVSLRAFSAESQTHTLMEPVGRALTLTFKTTPSGTTEKLQGSSARVMVSEVLVSVGKIEMRERAGMGQVVEGDKGVDLRRGDERSTARRSVDGRRHTYRCGRSSCGECGWLSSDNRANLTFRRGQMDSIHSETKVVYVFLRVSAVGVASLDIW